MDELFNNPMVDAARKNLTPEQIQNYKEIGEKIHSYDYINNKPCIKDFSAMHPSYILQYVMDGLPVSELTASEIKVMEAEYGPNWIQAICSYMPPEYVEGEEEDDLLLL